jgi:hypothetical protein
VRYCAGSSVTCDPTEAEQALVWARAHPAWVEDPAPLYALDPNARARPDSAYRAGDSAGVLLTWYSPGKNAASAGMSSVQTKSRIAFIV